MTEGLSTASAGNMARAVAWLARRHGVPATMIVPDSAPAAKLEPVRALGAQVLPVPFERWWQVMEEGGHPDLSRAFLHPVRLAADDGRQRHDWTGARRRAPRAGGGGGAVRGWRAGQRHRLRGEGAASGDSRLRHRGRGRRRRSPPHWRLAGRWEIKREPSFVDGIGSGTVLAAMWPLVSSMLDGSIVVGLEQVESAMRLLGDARAGRGRGRGRGGAGGGPHRSRGRGSGGGGHLRRQPRPGVVRQDRLRRPGMRFVRCLLGAGVRCALGGVHGLTITNLLRHGGWHAGGQPRRTSRDARRNPSPGAPVGWGCWGRSGQGRHQRGGQVDSGPRMSMTAYLFGGRDGAGRAFDDLWAYDLATDRWQLVRGGRSTGPLRTQRGVGRQRGAGRLRRAEPDHLLQRPVGLRPGCGSGGGSSPGAATLPVARYGSCAAIGPDGRLWISHGFTSEGSRFADTRAYDFGHARMDRRDTRRRAPGGALPARLLVDR